MLILVTLLVLTQLLWNNISVNSISLILVGGSCLSQAAHCVTIPSITDSMLFTAWGMGLVICPPDLYHSYALAWYPRPARHLAITFIVKVTYFYFCHVIFFISRFCIAFNLFYVDHVHAPTITLPLSHHDVCMCITHYTHTHVPGAGRTPAPSYACSTVHPALLECLPPCAISCSCYTYLPSGYHGYHL